MREIRFRGKRVNNGEWVYGFIAQNEIYPYNGTNIKAYIWKIPCVENLVEIIPETVGQYTGLKDKNGAEIYEGDVVWCRAGEHAQGIWEYEKRFIVEYGWSESMWEMSMCHAIEVIGNIYDNPEPLGG